MHDGQSRYHGQLWFRRWIGLLLCALGFLLVSPARADRVPSLVAGGKAVEVPKELLSWVPWVTQSVTDGLCPRIGEEELCLWPAALTLEVAKDGAEFSFEVYVETDGWQTLPGSSTHWPESVQIDAKPAVVLARAASPVTQLTKGAHRLTGRFVWSHAPETLPLPANVGVVRLRVNGQPIDFPRREQSGALWLQAGGRDGDAASDRAELQVFRRFEDGVPLRVTTLLILTVAGKTRELRLAGSTLPGSRSLAIDSPIPARYEPNGDLVLHAHTGEHRITLSSLFITPPDSLVLPPEVAPWPEFETWVYVPNNAIRQVEIQGAPGVDTAQTNLPDEWKANSAWLMSKNRRLVFETKRRGEPEPAPNQIKLTRDWWLDFDGEGYTASDQLTGTLSRSFRLDLAAAPLGRAALNGKDLLVTRSANGQSGVEVTQSKLSLKAEWRLEKAKGELPAVGWQADVNELTSTLHLPPGWDILHATGVDHASETWWSNWSLWGFFYVLLVSIAIARLFGPSLGVLAFATLVITYERADAPMAFWAVLLVFLALLRLVPNGWFRRVLRVAWLATVLLFAVLAVQFSIGEVRGAFFPTTRAPHGVSYGDAPEAGMLISQHLEVEEQSPGPVAGEPAPPASVEETKADDAEAAKVAVSRSSLQSSSGLANAKSKLRRLASESYEGQLVDPEAIVQTGPGLPSWHWKRVELRWSGPVRHDQLLQLYLLGPTWNMLLGVLRVLGTALLAFWLVRKTPFGENPPPLPELLRRRMRPQVVSVAALLLLLCLPGKAEAEPRSEILEDLKTRLLKAPDCEGCLEVESLELAMKGRALETRALVHSGKVTDYRVPGPVQSWVPARVLVDGRAAVAMVLGQDGFLHVRLEPGTHRVQTTGPVAGNELVIAPGSSPHRVTVTATGWTVDGLRDGRVDNSLHFIASLQPNPKSGEPDAAYKEGSRLPPWLEITRQFELGVTWKVTTEILRKSPTGEPISLRYALLPGEEVTTNQAIVEQGQLVVTLGRDDAKMSYQSVLRQTEHLVLTAASERPFNEEWRVRCGSLWHCEFAGVAPYTRTDEGGYAPRFRPWPKEQLTLQIRKPPPVPGESHTIERISAVVTPGLRLLAGNLELSINVSKAYTQSLRLEPGSVVQSLSINGHSEPIRMKQDKLELSLQPGRQKVALSWHEPRPQAFFFRTPRIEIGEKAVNCRVTLQLPSDRWLLLTWGPSWGPKVLLWSYLLMLISSAWLLVRLPKNPLKLWQWVLLGIGLTQVPLAVTVIIVAWFFVMAIRGGLTVKRPRVKGLMQIALALYTLAFLGCLFGAVYDGLVSNPDMLVEGQGSTESSLVWYVDKITGSLPTAVVVSLPVVVFRLLNLLWALWLASSLLGWLRWGWSEYAKDGLWVAKPPIAATAVDARVNATPNGAVAEVEGAPDEHAGK